MNKQKTLANDPPTETLLSRADVKLLNELNTALRRAEEEIGKFERERSILPIPFRP